MMTAVAPDRAQIRLHVKARKRHGRAVPPLYRGIADAALRSRAAAVKLFCLECTRFVRRDVTGCTAPHCPLFPWRPYQGDALDALARAWCVPMRPQPRRGRP